MPLDLTLTVEVDAAKAKAELREIEQGVKGVEQAGTKAQDPVQKMVQALSGQSAATDKVVRSSVALTDTTQNLVGHNDALEAATRKLVAAKGDWAKLTTDEFMLLGQSGRLNADLHQQLDQIDESYKALNATRGASAAAVGLEIGAVTALIAVASGEIAFVYQSSKAYVEKSGILDQHRESINGVKDAWEDLLFLAGQELVGSGQDFTGWIDMLSVGLRLLGAEILRRIHEFNELIDLIDRFGKFAITADPLALIGSDLPTPANALRDVNGDLTAAGYLKRNQDRVATSLRMDRGDFAVPSAEEAQRIFDASERERAAEDRRRQAELERAEAAFRKLVEAYTGADVIRKAHEHLKAITQAAAEGTPILKMTAQQQADINKIMGEAIDVYRRHAQVAPEAIRLTWLATLQGIPAAKDFGTAWKDVGTQIQLAGKAAAAYGYLFGPFVPTTADVHMPEAVSGISTLPGFKLSKPEAPLVPDAWFDELDRLARDIVDLGRLVPGVAGDLLELGGTGVMAFGRIADASERLNRQIAQGKATFADYASFALSSGLQVLGIMQQIVAFLERDNLTGRQVREFEDQYGGRRGLEAAAALAGVSLQGLDTDSAETFEHESERVAAAIDAQREALDRYNLSWTDFNATVAQTQVDQITRDLMDDFRNLTGAGANPEAVISGMSGALNQLIVDAVRSGTRIPGALQPIIEQMIRMGLTTDAAARALLGLADDGMPALEDIRAAAERYGLTLDQLGPKVQQLSIDDQAAQIIADWDLLVVKAGASGETVARGMQAQLQGLVTTALQMGLTIPENLRPILQTLVDLGLLVDENGVKLESLDRVPFGRNLTQAIDDLILKLDELIDHFNDAASAAEAVGARPNDSGEIIGHAVPRGGGEVEPPPDSTSPPDSAPPPPSEDPGVIVGGRPNPFDTAHAGGYLLDGRVLPFGGTFHAGGLAPDEFYIKAQSREFVMQRAAVDYYGGAFMHAVNQRSFTPAPTSTRRDVTIHVPVHLDGRTIAEVVARETLE